jgi:hypothetical protein
MAYRRTAGRLTDLVAVPLSGTVLFILLTARYMVPSDVGAVYRAELAQ